MATMAEARPSLGMDTTQTHFTPDADDWFGRPQSHDSRPACTLAAGSSLPNLQRSQRATDGQTRIWTLVSVFTCYNLVSILPMD
jgi:hypothetical protein